MNVLILDSRECQPGGLALVRGHRAVHLRTVLGAEPGKVVRVGMCRGALGSGRVVSVRDDEVTLEVELEVAAPAPPEVELVLAVPRPKVLRRVLAMVASLGVARIDLVNAWRVEKSYFASPVLAEAAMRAALWDGIEQGGHTWLPDVVVHRRLMQFFEQRVPALGTQRLIAHPRTGQFAETVLRQGPVVLAVGPEGGWIQRELETFFRSGFVACDLGMPVLRVESAVPALFAQVAMARRAL